MIWLFLQSFYFRNLVIFSIKDDNVGHPIDSSPNGYFQIFKILNREKIISLNFLSFLKSNNSFGYPFGRDAYGYVLGVYEDNHIFGYQKLRTTHGGQVLGQLETKFFVYLALGLLRFWCYFWRLGIAYMRVKFKAIQRSLGF